VTALRVACVLTLVGLAFMCWSMLQPTWIPVMVAMSVGQIIGTTAFAIFGITIVRDLRRSYRQRETPP
jgi:membrane protein implicated in regulation of membrane protease activity